MWKFYENIRHFIRKISGDQVGAFAAQSAFFMLLSLIPLLLLLLTMIQYTPITKANVLEAVVQVFPKSVNRLVISVVDQVYNQSKAIIPLTALTALWSAGRGVLSMTTGLNSVYGIGETRNYVFLRIRAMLYTLLFLIMILLSLLLLVFGNSLALFLSHHYPIMESVIAFVIRIRTVMAFLVLIVFSMLMYKFLPNHKRERKVLFLRQFPGAVVTALGWLVTSYIFSVYLDVFKGFSDMYGSLTTIVLVMLWFYFCMYEMLLGGEVNVVLEENRILEENS